MNEDEANAEKWKKNQPGADFVARVFMAGTSVANEEKRLIVAPSTMLPDIGTELCRQRFRISEWHDLDGSVGSRMALRGHSEAGRRLWVHLLELDNTSAVVTPAADRVIVAAPTLEEGAEAFARAFDFVRFSQRICFQSQRTPPHVVTTGPKTVSLEVASERGDAVPYPRFASSLEF